RETARLQGNTMQLTQRLLDAGRGTQRDVDQARVLVEQANAQVPQLEAERRAQLYALAALTGRPPAELDAAAAQCRAVPKVATVIPVGDGAALLARRPDVRQAERTLAADTARIGIATSQLFPSVTLAGTATLGAPHIGDIGKAKSFSYSLGPLISWTFPNIAVAAAQIRQARGQADASLAAFQGTVLTALKETEQALARYAASLDQNAALARASQAADDAAKLARIRFDTGRDSFLDLLVAEQNRATARQALAQSDTRVADAQVSLFKALGGGWENAPPAVNSPPPPSVSLAQDVSQRSN
ncbi:MAG TPA: TolC family protein, partial [Sphingomonas sp.]|nr:TolC family protein [Sphingomonas sp.]